MVRSPARTQKWKWGCCSEQYKIFSTQPLTLRKPK